MSPPWARPICPRPWDKGKTLAQAAQAHMTSSLAKPAPAALLVHLFPAGLVLVGLLLAG